MQWCIAGAAIKKAQVNLRFLWSCLMLKI